jgi:hypothetical protein
MNRVIEDIEYQIENLKTRSYSARNLARASEGLDSAQKWYQECHAARVDEEQLIAEYQVALEILKLRGVRS